MSKDVCPFCGTEELKLVNVNLQGGAATVNAECYECAKCRGRFMSLQQVEDLLKNYERGSKSKPTYE